ncbi:MAG: SDR family NAD(P)-dependent oxidoreductase, partial [Sedimentisphaerales bacterium]|nr:SDR family NAD(P)-dependent oxidoreductase [Sedimentisphaerales bacterium]
MRELFDMTGKVTVITGAGGILCGTMAKALAKAGAKVAVLDLRKEAAVKVADDIKADGGEAIAIKCDVLRKDSLEAAKEEVNAEFGKIDILINGAGGNKKEATTSPDLPFFDLPLDAIRFVFELNF